MTDKAAWSFICALSIAFLAQAIPSMWDDSPTFDEMINPSVGYAELLTGDLSLIDDHPPLARFLTALPFLFIRPTAPLDHHSWQKRTRGVYNRSDLAHQFFFVANDDADSLLFWSRVPVLFLSLLLGLLVFQWAKTLYGVPAGVLAFFLYTFEPNIIAHSRLATNDLLVALFVFATVYQFWQYHQLPSTKSLVMTGVLLGLALTSKFSAIMLFPILLLLSLMAANASTDPPDSWLSLSRRTLSVQTLWVALPRLFFILIIASGVILLSYGTQWGLFVDGLYATMAHYEGGHKAFFMGNYSEEGWWLYYPVVVALKSPLPFLILLIAALLFGVFGRKRLEYFLLVPLGVIIASAIFSHINIGVRYILAFYLFGVVFASSVTTIKFSRPRILAFGVAGLVVWQALSTLSCFPHYIAYFNALVAQERAHQVVVDSNLDWGQDLKRLRRFMERSEIRRVYLSYFGSADPCYYGIPFLFLPGSFFSSSYQCMENRDGLRADFVAISVTNLQSVYLPDKRTFNWLKSHQPIAQIGHSIFVYDIRENISAHDHLAEIYSNYGLPEEALKERVLVARLAPERPASHSNLGLAYHSLSLFEKASEAYGRALQLDPENQVAKEGLQALGQITRPDGSDL